MNSKQHKLRNGLLYTGIALVVGLVAVRVALPYVIKNKINDTLANSLTDYTGSIDDFDLALWRGTYFVQGLKLKKRDAPKDDYMVKVQTIEVDVAWKALFKGEVRLDVLLDQPNVTIFDAEKAENQQTGKEEKNWNMALTSLFPFSLQSLQVDDGRVAFRRLSSGPPVEIELDDLQLLVSNIGNTETDMRGKLPSEFNMNARFQKQATLSSSGKLKVYEPPYAANVSADLTSFEIPSLNEFFKTYGFFDITEGSLEAKANLQMAWPNIDLTLGVRGKKLDVVAPAQKFLGLRGVVTELGVALVNLIAKNPDNDVLATRLRIKGNYPNLEVNTWEAVKDLFDDRVQ